MAREPKTSAADLVASLSQAMKDEASVMWQLRDAMVRQRASVAADDTEEIDASVQEVGRTLFTLAEARKRTASVMSYLTGEEEPPLAQLELHLGTPLPLGLETARAEVRLAAQSVAHEAAINRNVLQGAREAADTFLQELFSASSNLDAVYHPGDRGDDGTGGAGLLFNRTA